ncbi:MAG: hypothetical protein M3N31_09635 [Actinomycetota bacterium]|nr:hypothetical protein [Actinomycetota bacterium]
MNPSRRMLAVARPFLLWTLLLGIVLTLILAPSALDAQQGPPSQAPASGYGTVGQRGPMPPRELALLADDDGASTTRQLLTFGLPALLLAGGGIALLRMRRT